MKRILQLLFVSAIAFSCAEQELETSAPNFASEDATVTLILDDVPEDYEGDSVYVFTRNNEGEIYALTSGTATNGATIAVVPTPGGTPFTLIAYITTDEDWIENLAEMTTMPTSPKFSSGFYSASGNLTDKEGTYVTSSWGVEVDGPADADAGSLGAVIEISSFTTNAVDNNDIAQGAILQLSASIADNINSGITSVQFLLDGSEIETIENSPYTINWNTIDVATGEYELSVVATNVAGNTATEEIEIRISTAANQAPSVSFSLSYIENGGSGFGGIGNLEEVERQELVDFNFNITDDSGLERVEIFIAGSEVENFTGDELNSLDYDWDTFDNSTGTVTIEVRAIDIDGESRSAFLNVILVDPDNFLPRASLTAPSSGASFTAGDLITISANASDNEGDAIDRLVFYIYDFDGNLVATITDFDSPYSVDYDSTGDLPGDYTIEVRAYANCCNYTISDSRTITIN